MHYLFLVSLSLLCALTLCLTSCRTPPTADEIAVLTLVAAAVEEDELAAQQRVEISPYLEDVWLHTTWRLYGSTLIPSHGLIVVEPDALWLIDSAWGDDYTLELLNQIAEQFGRSPDALLVTHAHEDRASGLEYFTERQIPIWASEHTMEILPPERQAHITHLIESPETPSQFASSGLTVYWPGPGHTHDNVVVWEPRNKLVFGGCLIRPADSASLGNTDDADLAQWGQSVAHVSDTFPEVIHVVPAHGEPGGPEVLRHTIDLMQNASLAP